MAARRLFKAQPNHQSVYRLGFIWALKAPFARVMQHFPGLYLPRSGLLLAAPRRSPPRRRHGSVSPFLRRRQTFRDIDVGRFLIGILPFAGEPNREHAQVLGNEAQIVAAESKG